MKEIREMDELEIKKELEFAHMARAFFESVGGFISTDMDGKVTYVSRRMAKALGTTVEESVGRPVDEVLPITNMPDIAEKAKEEDKVYPEISFASPGNTIRSRMVVYEEGWARKEKAMGVAAFDLFDMRSREQGQTELLNAMERLFLAREGGQELLAAVYTADRHPSDILGSSSRMKQMKELIVKAAPSLAAVCILGETGTGKELVANAIHNLSKRADKPFVKINCAAIPKDLMESELFGYEPGAFTGASKSGKLGKFELASGGTLMLDEIGELPLNLQAKLLRVLQSQELERVGGTKPVPINVRLICSTNRDLRQMVHNGEFRADLYYRINTMEIFVPPLRERKQDIPDLCARFIEEANRRNDLSVTGVSDGAMAYLLEHEWPGNVRELENTVERACVLCGRGMLQIYHFAFLGEGDGEKVSGRDCRGREATLLPAQEVMPPVAPLMWNQSGPEERAAIVKALRACRGKRGETAELLRISRTTLYLKMKKYGLI